MTTEAVFDPEEGVWSQQPKAEETKVVEKVEKKAAKKGRRSSVPGEEA